VGWHGTCLSTTALIGDALPNSKPQLTRGCATMPGCKRLHLSYGSSQRDRPSGRVKSQILSGVRGRGCVRRASSSRPRAHRRRPRPVVWVGGCESGGLRCRQLKPAFTSASSAGPSRCPPGSHVPGLPRDPHSPWAHPHIGGSPLTLGALLTKPLPPLPQASSVLLRNCPAASACI